MELHPAIIALGFLVVVFGGAALATGLVQGVMPF